MRRINTRALIAVLAVVLAILGIASLVVWTNGARERAFSGTETVTVWQVVKDVPAGTEADSLGGSVNQVNLPKAGVPSTAVNSLAAVSGKVTTSSLVPGEILVSGRFGSTKDAQEIPVPKGLQEVTIEVGAARVMGGVVQRGDRVGILTSYARADVGGETNFAVNRALVLAVTPLSGTAPSDDQAAPSGNIQVRFALESLDVAEVVNAAEFGKIWLARQSKDADVARTRISPDDVLK